MPRAMRDVLGFMLHEVGLKSTGHGALQDPGGPLWASPHERWPPGPRRRPHIPCQRIMSRVGMWGCLASFIPHYPLTNRPFPVFLPPSAVLVEMWWKLWALSEELDCQWICCSLPASKQRPLWPSNQQHCNPAPPATGTWGDSGCEA